MKTVFEKIMRVGKVATFCAGLAAIIGLSAGLAATAIAADGKPFLLGRNNPADAVSRLIKDGAGPALELRVGSGPPLKVDSAARVANLNADKVDGKDSTAFFSGDTYEVQDGRTGPGGGRLAFRFVSCDEGDLMLSGGGGGSVSDGDDLRSSSGSGSDGWTVFVLDNNNPSGVVAEGTCADFPPLRP